jgi:hypothetical protein
MQYYPTRRFSVSYDCPMSEPGECWASAKRFAISMLPSDPSQKVWLAYDVRTSGPNGHVSQERLSFSWMPRAEVVATIDGQPMGSSGTFTVTSAGGTFGHAG